MRLRVQAPEPDSRLARPSRLTTENIGVAAPIFTAGAAGRVIDGETFFGPSKQEGGQGVSLEIPARPRACSLVFAPLNRCGVHQQPHAQVLIYLPFLTPTHGSPGYPGGIPERPRHRRATTAVAAPS
jgi:hypothetical protein